MADPKILIFGAGRIGRSFIGALFGNRGYSIVFADVDRSLVKELNRRKEYPVIIRGPETSEKLIIKPVRAVHAADLGAVAEEVCEAYIMAVAVGKNALLSVAQPVAEGLQERCRRYPGKTLDIILAENMRSAASFFREALRKELPDTYPLDELVGLVETSIGKMVPIMTGNGLQEDPLQVFAEPYHTLILDRKGFIGPVPEIPEFSLKENMKAWVDRKAFIHNLGHAAAAYYGHVKHPGAVYMYEVLDDPEVFGFTRNVMLESAAVLMAGYPGEFTREELTLHIDDLLERFRNRNLGDTVYRVGSDLKRKLGADDRFMGILKMAEATGSEYALIVRSMAMGFLFRATDEKGRMLPGDVEFRKQSATDLDRVLADVCGVSPGENPELYSSLKNEVGRILTRNT